MGRTKEITDIIVILRMLIGIPHDEPDRRSRRLSFEDATEQFYLVRLIARGRHLALAGAATGELMLDKVEIKVYPCRHTVDNAADSSAMTLTEGRQRKDIPKRISHNKLFVDGFCYKGTLFASILIPRSG